jgi:hypothetical protein
MVCTTALAALVMIPPPRSGTRLSVPQVHATRHARDHRTPTATLHKILRLTLLLNATNCELTMDAKSQLTFIDGVIAVIGVLHTSLGLVADGPEIREIIATIGEDEILERALTLSSDDLRYAGLAEWVAQRGNAGAAYERD